MAVPQLNSLRSVSASLKGIKLAGVVLLATTIEACRRPMKSSEAFTIQQFLQRLRKAWRETVRT